MENDKGYIKGLGLSDIQSLVKSLGFPEFHGEQIYQWMYRHGVVDFSAMTNLPKDLLDILDFISDLISSNFLLSPINSFHCSISSSVGLSSNKDWMVIFPTSIITRKV